MDIGIDEYDKNTSYSKRDLLYDCVMNFICYNENYKFSREDRLYDILYNHENSGIYRRYSKEFIHYINYKIKKIYN